MEEQMIYTGSVQNIALNAVATDGDGVVQQVAFYVNGELVVLMLPHLRGILRSKQQWII